MRGSRMPSTASLLRLAAWLALGALPTMPLLAQAQPTEQQPARPNDTWEGQQKGQAWATARLARSPLRHEWVSIPVGRRVIRAFVTWPGGTRKAPVVLVLHEVFGLTDSTLNTADQIAAMGAITIAPDMVSGMGPGGGDVRSFANSHLTSDAMTGMEDSVVNTAIDGVAGWGLKQARSDGHLAIVGLSWGGGAAFRYAASGAHSEALKCVSVFYDVGPPTVTQGPRGKEPGQPPFSVGAINVPVYGFYPDGDTRVMNSLPATRAAMAAAGKPFDPVIYRGAEHAYMRLGSDPANANPANAAAVKASLTRLNRLIKPL